MENILYEKELYEPVKRYLTHHGFEVRAEVKDCDLVAKRDDIVLVVELKRHLSFDLLAQAVSRQNFADGVYVGVPKPNKFKIDKGWRSRLKVLEQLRLGLLLISKTNGLYIVEEALAPGTPETLRKNKKKRGSLEKEFSERRLDLNIGGCSGVPLVTAYREASLHLAYLINREGPLSPKALKQLGGHPKKTSAILSADHYHWFIRQPDQTYSLTESGKEALETYSTLIEAFEHAHSTNNIAQDSENPA